MEVALGSAALVGAGLIWNRVNSSSQPSAVTPPSGVHASRVVREPIASNFRGEESSYAKATAVPPMTQIPSGSLSTLASLWRLH